MIARSLLCLIYAGRIIPHFWISELRILRDDANVYQLFTKYQKLLLLVFS